jgi:hypothetical protein
MSMIALKASNFELTVVDLDEWRIVVRSADILSVWEPGLDEMVLHAMVDNCIAASGFVFNEDSKDTSESTVIDVYRNHLIEYKNLANCGTAVPTDEIMSDFLWNAAAARSGLAMTKLVDAVCAETSAITIMTGRFTSSSSIARRSRLACMCRLSVETSPLSSSAGGPASLRAASAGFN